jgi:DNA polymerase I-like protein with 3'-5' exonuclease and polymerase domains
MKQIAVDIETSMDHKTIHLVVTQDIQTGETIVWNSPSGLTAYLEKASQLIAYNGLSFDFPILNKVWGTTIGPKRVYDPLVVSRLLEPTREKGHSLASWGETLKLAKIEYERVWEWLNNRRQEYKGECYDNPHMALLEHYCKRDVDVLVRVFHHVEKELESFYCNYNKDLFPLKKDKPNKECFELEHKVAQIINKQEKNGFKLDTIHATCLLAELKGKMSAINDRMQEEYPPYEVERISEKTGKTLKPELVVFNPASRQQIAEKLIGLGWKPKKFTEPTANYPQGQAIVDESTLMGLKYPIAAMIAEYMMLGKRIAQIESWLEVVGADGRVHGRVITNGAVTGRMTHMKPNMAQIPNSGSPYGPECRQCWTVEEGNVLVGCDASGLELRMLAHYMKDENYVKTVTEGSSKDGTDVHTVNQKAAGLQTRDQAKTFIYAFLYGAGPAKIGSIVGGSSTAGQKLINAFLKGTPALQRLRDKVSVYASKGYVPGLDGRKIWVRSEHAALNSLLQGAGAIVMKKALVIFNDKIKANGWDVKLTVNVHDELQMECRPEIAEEVGKACVASIEEAGVAFKLRCPLTGEYKIGKTWRDTH